MGTAPAPLQALRAALGSVASTLDIAWVEETGSTNADLLDAARASVSPQRGSLLVAERQTAGRGRRGRRWHSTPGASLTLSLSWPMRAADLSGLSLAVGVGLAEALDPAHRPRSHIAIKWPNDLWLAGSDGLRGKLGGILIETTPIDGGRLVVVGIGLNVLEQRVADASSGVAWLAQLDGDARRDDALARVVVALVGVLERFDAEGFAAFGERFAARDLLLGRPVHCSGRSDADGIDGLAVGVTGRGELRVRSAHGIENVASGEVSVRMTEPAASATVQTASASC